MANLVEVEGIGPAYAKKLAAAGLKTTDALLAKGATPQGRKEISDKTDITPALVLKWVNHVDLFRIKGVGQEYGDLLEAAGVDTVPELAQRKPSSLCAKLAEVNKAKKLVRQLPAESQIAGWVEQAKKLPRVIKY